MVAAEATPPSIGDLVAAEAQRWIGTPFRWQAAVKGHGCDCKGLVIGVARELGLNEAESLYGLKADYRADRKVDTALLAEGLAALFDRVDGMLLPGDVLLLRHNGAAQHLAIVTAFDAERDDGRVVHAQIAPSDRVKEARLGALLAKCPLVSAWRWRPRAGGTQ